MSGSNLKLPTSTELEGRVREALKVARENEAFIESRLGWSDHSAGVGLSALQSIIRILEDGKS